MSTLTIVSWPVLNFHRPGTSARLKIWFGQDFVTAESQHVLGGAVRSGSIYLDVALDLDPDTHELTIPAFALPTTDDSSVRNVRATGVLFDSSGAFVRNLFTNFIIPSELAPTTTFASLNAWNSAPTLPPQAMGITREQAIVLIEEGLSGEPINGTLSTNFVPRASAAKTLEDSQITDDGTDVGIQTLNKFQAGDFENLQNGSYISVNDTFGRANLFAGGDSNDEYAGFSCACDSGKGKVFVQSTNYTHLYGSEGVTQIGDGQDENNATKIVVDDPNQLIKLFNLPTADPGVAKALWNSNGTLKVSAG